MHLRTQTGHLTHKHTLYTPLTILEGHPQVQWFYCRSWLTAPSSSMARKVIWITKPHANTKGALLGKTRHDARNPMSAAKVCIQNKLQLWMPCTQHTGGRVSDVINSQKKKKKWLQSGTGVGFISFFYANALFKWASQKSSSGSSCGCKMANTGDFSVIGSTLYTLDADVIIGYCFRQQASFNLIMNQTEFVYFPRGYSCMSIH